MVRFKCVCSAHATIPLADVAVVREWWLLNVTCREAHERRQGTRGDGRGHLLGYLTCCWTQSIGKKTTISWTIARERRLACAQPHFLLHPTHERSPALARSHLLPTPLTLGTPSHGVDIVFIHVISFQESSHAIASISDPPWVHGLPCHRSGRFHVLQGGMAATVCVRPCPHNL